jgi:integrase
MKQAELDLARGSWAIPAERTKNGRAHEVPLSDAAIKVLKSLPRIGERFVFTTTGDTPISGFSRDKRRLDETMERARRQALGLPIENEAYRRQWAPRRASRCP